MELSLEVIGILLSGVLVIIFILDFWYKRKEDREKKRKELLEPLYKDVKEKKEFIENYETSETSPLYVSENLRPFVDENPDTSIKVAKICKEFQEIGRVINEFDKTLEKIRKNCDTAHEKIRKKVIEKYEKDNLFKSEADAFMFNPKNRELIGGEFGYSGLVRSILTGEVEYIDMRSGIYKSEYIEFIKKYKDAFLEIRKEIKEIKEGEMLYEELYKKICGLNKKIRKELKIDLCIWDFVIFSLKIFTSLPTRLSTKSSKNVRKL